MNGLFGDHPVTSRSSPRAVGGGSSTSYAYIAQQQLWIGHVGKGVKAGVATTLTARPMCPRQLLTYRVARLGSLGPTAEIETHM
jgi:hypothetical protein